MRRKRKRKRGREGGKGERGQTQRENKSEEKLEIIKLPGCALFRSNVQATTIWHPRLHVKQTFEPLMNQSTHHATLKASVLN